ncbi:hypothetical protein PGT21_002214 [Puccinia graminis f. sp. tritici]|uniref:Uncharacterized protein n=1 Tax=Puccinia graminis f. sp. tritici TaxID=56615 RepID=A0A5B0LWF9_PUCGR|nr:hypothetical protein PGT21_002214 [Puccinia graminis f. sp. tritici]KAA1081677.1 hypothetical protein PGTUg99_027442 [Puccinia graminis f. sp. tritici]
MSTMYVRYLEEIKLKFHQLSLVSLKQMVLCYSDLVTQWKEVSVNLHKSCTNYHKHIDERVCSFVSMTCPPL